MLEYQTLEWYEWLPYFVGVAVSLWTVWQVWHRRHRYKRLRYAYLAIAGSVLGWYSFRDMSVAIINHTEYNSFTYKTWIIAALLQITIGIVGLVIVGATSYWTYRWFEFCRVFGFAPPSSHDEEREKGEMADERLRWLARWMQKMFDLESAVLREVSEESEVGSEKYHELEEMKGWVAAAKKRFWLAHSISKNLCLQVHPSYKDYLPNIGKDRIPAGMFGAGRGKRTKRNSSPSGGE